MQVQDLPHLVDRKAKGDGKMEEKKQEIINFCLDVEIDELMQFAEERFIFYFWDKDNSEIEYFHDGINKIITYLIKTGTPYEEVFQMIEASKDHIDFIILTHEKIRE